MVAGFNIRCKPYDLRTSWCFCWIVSSWSLDTYCSCARAGTRTSDHMPYDIPGQEWTRELDHKFYAQNDKITREWVSDWVFECVVSHTDTYFLQSKITTFYYPWIKYVRYTAIDYTRAWISNPHWWELLGSKQKSKQCYL